MSEREEVPLAPAAAEWWERHLTDRRYLRGMTGEEACRQMRGVLGSSDGASSRDLAAVAKGDLVPIDEWMAASARVVAARGPEWIRARRAAK